MSSKYIKIQLFFKHKHCQPYLHCRSCDSFIFMPCKTIMNEWHRMFIWCYGPTVFGFWMFFFLDKLIVTCSFDGMLQEWNNCRWSTCFLVMIHLCPLQCFVRRIQLAILVACVVVIIFSLSVLKSGCLSKEKPKLVVYGQHLSVEHSVSQAFFRSRKLVIWSSDHHPAPAYDAKDLLEPLGVRLLQHDLSPYRYCSLFNLCEQRKSLKVSHIFWNNRNTNKKAQLLLITPCNACASIMSFLYLQCSFYL